MLGKGFMAFVIVNEVILMERGRRERGEGEGKERERRR